jgi:hypothetical protein
MQDIPLVGGPVEMVGALDIERTPTGLVPRRLPAWTRPQIPDLFMDVMVGIPSGVRLRFVTDSTSIHLDVMLTLIRQMPRPLRPAMFDLVIDGTLQHQYGTTEGNVITVVGLGPTDITFGVGEQTTIHFDGLHSGQKLIELWLPQATSVELRAMRVDPGATALAASEHDGLRWVHYGSSISHCFEAESPTGTWPAVAARDAGVDLLSLGFAGQCMLDQFVARTIRDLPADVISLKVGINIVNGDTMRERAFGSAVHGFLDTVRDGHPHTPILLVSPIFCPSAEDRPGPTIPGPDGRFVTLDGSQDLRHTCMTLRKIRATLAAIVQSRVGLGDIHLHHLDGLQLFGADDAADLPDDLHPNAAGYARMGHRFTQFAFGPQGPFAGLIRGR